MYGTPEMATQRQVAMRREAEAYRLTKETRAGRASDRRRLPPGGHCGTGHGGLAHQAL